MDAETISTLQPNADELNETELQEKSQAISTNADSYGKRSSYSSAELIQHIVSKDLTKFNALKSSDQDNVIEDACNNNDNVLLQALTFGAVDIAWRILQNADSKMSELDYKSLIFATDEHGNNWPILAVQGLWTDDQQKYLNLLKQFRSNGNLYTVENDKGETALMLLLKHETAVAAANIDHSHFITQLKQLCRCDSSEVADQQCYLCHKGIVSIIALDKVSRSDVRNFVNTIHWGYEWIVEVARESQWLDMTKIVHALPPKKDMQPLLELLLKVDDKETSALQHMLKESAFEALESLFNKQKCEPCLKQTLMKSYWKKRFHNLEMPLLAIKAFDDAGFCTESYLIPKPGDDLAMSRPLAMMFYNEGNGEPISAKDDATALEKAFRYLGWPESSVQIQPEDLKWSCNQLLDRVRSQLKPKCPVIPVVLSMPLLMLLQMFLLGVLLMNGMVVLRIFYMVMRKYYSWYIDSYPDSLCYSCCWWWSYNFPSWSAGLLVCWLLYRFSCYRLLPDRRTTNTTNTTNATNCSLFILSISAHGSAGTICAHRGRDLQIKDILDLVHKLLPPYIPKVIIIDACQNELPWPFANPGVYTRRENMLLLISTVRGEYSRGRRYSIYLAKEIKIGNDSLQNMHCRAALKTMSHKKEAKGEKRSESPPDQVAVSQSTTAKKIFLRNFNHTDRCHKKDCKVSDDKTGYVTCSNCPAMYHVVCIAKERYEKRERLVPKNLPALKKCGVQWFCTKCEERFVRL